MKPKKIVDQMSEAGFAIGLVEPESTLIDSEKRINQVIKAA